MKPWILAPWLLTLLALPLMAQEGKLVVLEPQSKELKRAAHRLGIPAEQLRNARRLLQEATDLACRIDPPPFNRFHELTSLWQQINGTQAQAAVKRLIDVACSTARDATNIGAYRYATSTAFMMIGEVYPADFETVRQLIRDWPPPPASEGKSAHHYLAVLERQLRQRSLQHLALNDPDKAALRDLLLSPDRLYRQLRGKGKSDPGFARAKLRAAAGRPGGINELITLAHMAARNDPELADIALEEARSLLPGIRPLER